MEASIAVAEQSADAAQRLATHIRNAERPYLTPFAPELRYFIERAHGLPYADIYLDITNIGKGVGFIKSYGIAHDICIGNPQCAAPLKERDWIARLPISPDAKWDAGAPFDLVLINDAERQEILDFRKSLYMYGYVRYGDLFGITRRTGFLFEYAVASPDSAKSTFVMRPHSMWYDIEEEEAD
jgi:hypothetical protein